MTTATPPRHTFDAPAPEIVNLPQLAREARNNRYDAGLQQNYGLALIRAGRAEASLVWLEAALQLQPENAAHHVNLSSTYRRLERDWHRAYWHAAEAHRLDPSSPLATHNLAAVHLHWGEVEEAAAWYRKTLDLDPSHWAIWFNWLYALDFLPISAEEARRARAEFNAAIQAPLRGGWMRHENDPDPDRRLRIGFVGGDFRAHSASAIFAPILEHLDRERYEVICFADAWQYDDLTDWFEGIADTWNDVSSLTDPQLAALIRHDRVDVLIDLGAFTQKSRLMAHLAKPAPLSVTAWGNLVGTGLDCMDGILIDRVILPEDRRHEVTETPCYVPYALGFTPPNDAVEIHPREDGAPLVFGYLGRVQKITDPTVALWAELLHAYPGSQLLLKDGAYGEERVATRTRERFEAWGINPDRVELRYHTPRPEHLAAYNDVDVSLDPISQSGGTTPLEALWMGTPSVALCDPSARFVSRLSASSLSAAGRPEWVAKNVHEYVEIAGRIAGQGGPALRESFLASGACDSAGRTRAFEDAVRELWRGWCRDERYRRACEL